MTMEAADSNAKSLKNTEGMVQKLNVQHTASTALCYRCGRTNHAAKDCRFRDTECNFCKKKGHRIRLQGTAIAEIHWERTTRTKAEALTGKATEHMMGGDWRQGV